MKKNIAIALTLFFTAFSFAGCSRATEMQNQIGLFTSYDRQRDEVLTEKSNEQRAAMVREEIVQIEGVEDAVVVITGRTALVGLQLDQVGDAEAVRIKKQAAEKAKELDIGVTNTAVTADQEISQMIKEL